MYRQKPNQFNLFINKNRREDKHPYYQGTIGLPDGSQMEMAAWIKETKGGEKYLSGKLSEPRQPKDHAPPADNSYAKEPEAKQPDEGWTDSIPF